MLLDERLKRGLETLQLPHDDVTVAKLTQYASLLKKWGKTYNLTALLNDEDILTHHLLDTAAFVTFFNQRIIGCKNVLDVGSGGGLPAVPLAIFRPDIEVVALDAVAKKTAFIQQVAIELGLKNLNVQHSRVELYQGSFDVVTSRAFSSLKDFLSLTGHLLDKDGSWLALKGAYPLEELKNLPTSVSYKVEPISVPYLNESRHIVVIKKLK